MDDEELRRLVNESILYAKSNKPARLHLVDITGQPRMQMTMEAAKYDGQDIWNEGGWSRATGVRAFVREEDAKRFYRRRVCEYAEEMARHAKLKEAEALRARASALEAEAKAIGQR